MLKRIFKRNKKSNGDGKESSKNSPNSTCVSPVHPIQHVDIFEKILPYVTGLQDLLNLRQVCRCFRDTVDSSKTFANRIQNSSWANLNEKNIKKFCKKSASTLPWTHFRLMDIKHKSFYESKEFRTLLGKMKTVSPFMEIRVMTNNSGNKILKRSVQQKIEEICRKEGLQVHWVFNNKTPVKKVAKESSRSLEDNSFVRQVIVHYYPNPHSVPQLPLPLLPFYMQQHI